MPKSYVTMEQQVCPICTKQHDTGSILMDRRLRDTFETHTVTGWGLCEECEQRNKDGYIALVGADPDKSDKTASGTIGLDGAWRTGSVVHLKREAATDILNLTEEQLEIEFMFCEEGVIEMLKRMQEASFGVKDE